MNGDSSQELEIAADGMDWDDELVAAYEIIRSPHCDLGTALKLYWRTGAQWYTQYSDEAEVPSLHRDGWFLCKEIERRVISGFYTRNTIVFDARNDDGSDHTADYLENPIRRPIPAQMFAPFPAPEPFSLDLLDRAIDYASNSSSANQFGATMMFLKRRIQSGTDLKKVADLVKERISRP